MKNFFLFFVLILSINMFSQDNYVKNCLIVKIKKDYVNENNIDLKFNTIGIKIFDDFNKKNGLEAITILGKYKISQLLLLKFSDAFDVEDLLRKYKDCIYVDDVCFDFYFKVAGEKINDDLLLNIPADPFFNRQWGFYNNGTYNTQGNVFLSVNDADVDLELAWDIQTGDPNLIIAFLDTGVRLSHNDISSRVWVKNSELINGIDDDGNGLIDDYRGWDFINNDNDPSDDYGHGTCIASIVGAIPNNNEGYVGVNWSSKLMVLKTMDNTGSGTASAIINSLYYAVDNGAKIVNISLSSTVNVPFISEAIDYGLALDVLYVCASGNSNASIVNYPAGYASLKDNVIAVGSTNSNDVRSNPFFWSSVSGSNYGNYITVVAPGNYIWSIQNTCDNCYSVYWGGTSQAAPIVSGIASLIKSMNFNLTPLQIKNIIKFSAQDQVGLSTEDLLGWDQYMGWGRVNANNALQYVLNNNLFDNTTQEINILNPVFNDIIEISSNGENIGDFEMTVFNLEGKLLKSNKINICIGYNQIPFEFPIGSYIVELKSCDYTKIIKILKK